MIENSRKWYAIYTKPRAEKKVFEELNKKGYEAYLPLRTVYRQWKDRIKKIEVPLFNSYVFVKIKEKEYYEILKKNIKGIVKFVTIGGEKLTVREEEITAIKKLLSHSQDNIEVSNEDFNLNDTIEIKNGSLRGLQGKLVEFRGKNRVAIRIESLKINLLIEIKKNAIKKIA